MPQITEDELAELQQLRALQAQQQAEAPVTPGGRGRPKPKPLTGPRRAHLADGTAFNYTGAHPTHVVGDDDEIVPVLFAREL